RSDRDWSSDVCSSDLAIGSGTFDAGAVGDERPIEVAVLRAEGTSKVTDAGAQVEAGVLGGLDEGGGGLGSAVELLAEGRREELQIGRASGRERGRRWA